MGFEFIPTYQVQVWAVDVHDMSKIGPMLEYVSRESILIRAIVFKSVFSLKSPDRFSLLFIADI